MIGRVTRYDSETQVGGIYSFSNKRFYTFHISDVSGHEIDSNYIVDFHVSFNEKLQKKCAKGITVIDSTDYVKKQSEKKKKKKNNKKHKACNADKVIKDDKEFRKFTRKFMREQKLNKEKTNGTAYK